MNILILMAGSDKDFCEKGYPKYLIEIKISLLFRGLLSS